MPSLPYFTEQPPYPSIPLGNIEPFCWWTTQSALRQLQLPWTNGKTPCRQRSETPTVNQWWLQWRGAHGPELRSAYLLPLLRCTRSLPIYPLVEIDDNVAITKYVRVIINFFWHCLHFNILDLRFCCRLHVCPCHPTQPCIHMLRPNSQYKGIWMWGLWEVVGH